MTTTTSYGTWNNRVEPHALTLEQSVFEALGDFADDYDLDALTAAYRDAINEALPAGVSLCGDEFIGPYESQDWESAGYPVDEDNRLDIGAIVEGVDFWKLAESFDKTATEEQAAPQWTARVNVVDGLITVEHDGEDADILRTPDGHLITPVIRVEPWAENEENLDRADAELAAQGLARVSEWNDEGNGQFHTCTVTLKPAS